MNARIVLVTTVAVSLMGCATTSKKGEIPTIESQSFATNIPGETIKIEKDCGLFRRTKCEVVSIEAVGTQSSVGATRVTQKQITEYACDNARSNIVKYVFGERVTENRKNISRNNQNENQKDRIKGKTEIGQDVELSADDPNKDTNYSIREALVNTNIDIIKTQTFASQGTLVGFFIKNTNVVDSKTISCTIKWNRNDANDLRNVRSLISAG